MRGPVPNMVTIQTDAAYRPTPDAEGDSQSSSSNSPARADYEESDFYAGNNDSQSSIGGTFQDMAVTEESSKSPANRLPAEVLIGIFGKLSSSHDLFNCMLVSKRWARNSVDLLWHRPACTTWDRHGTVCESLSQEHGYFAYRDFVKRLNLASLADDLNDGSISALMVCNRVERLTLTGCKRLTDAGLMGLLEDSNHLLALDISGDVEITALSMFALANNCRRLQGLNISGCIQISNDSMIAVAENCRFLKRLKLNDCEQLSDSSIIAFGEKCPNILEIDLHQCKTIGNDPITALLKNGQSLRELRLANCELITDTAFLSLPSNRTYEHLRILDLTSCFRLTDSAVAKIIEVAPRLRNLVFAKCRLLTDFAVHAISRLGKNLHYLHLGHCGQITDDAVIKLVQACNRIRYIDLGCCTHLTDASVTKLATLPKLRRIGLVKCSNITDESVYALAQTQCPREYRHIRPGTGGNNRYPEGFHGQVGSSLERVHLSYCTNLTLNSIVVLLNNCQKLTHLSLTGVQAFLRPDLEQFCREAPPEFSEHQRAVFCVFSGQGVTGLRHHLNTIPDHEYNPRHPEEQYEPYDMPMTGTAPNPNFLVGPGGANQAFGASHMQPPQIVPQDDQDDGDEELEDNDGGGVSFNGGNA